MDKTKHREQVKMSAHLGKLEFANQALHQTPDSPAVPAGAGGGAGELVVRVRPMLLDRSGSARPV